MTLDALIWLDESNLSYTMKGRLLHYAMGGEAEINELRRYGYVPPAERDDEAREAVVRDRNPVGTIYFVQAADGFIKIGFTTATVEARVRSIQTSTPQHLKILGSIDGANARGELALLERFSMHRISGEWFHPDPILFAIEHGTIEGFVARPAEEI